MTHCWKLAFTAAIVAGGMLGAAAQGHAAQITVNFSGTVAAVDPGLQSDFSVGNTLTGSYTFESTTPPRAGSTSTQAVFDALTGLSFSIGGYNAASGGAPEIQIDDRNLGLNVLTDRYGPLARASDGLTGPDAGGNQLSAFFFRLDDSSGAVFSDALLLPASLSLGDFDSTAFFVFFGPTALSGTIDSITFTGIPEPAMLALFGSGVLGAGLLGRRRQKR